MIKRTLPIPPYPLREGMNWEMDRNCLFVFDHGKPVMAISISEIIGEVRKMNEKARIDGDKHGEQGEKA